MASWTKGVWIVWAASLTLAVSGCAVNPLTGEEEPMFMSVDQELALGRQLAPEVEKLLNGAIPNEPLQRYVNRVGQRIARFSHHPDWEYRYVAVEDTMINALALPGGHVYITRGLLEKMTSEAQLAGILAHETVHIVARDSAVAMSKEKLMNAGFLAAIAASATGKMDPGALQAAQLSGYFVMLRYSRQDEEEADLGGLDYMVEAGYNPQAMVDTMQMFHDLDKVQPIEFLSTHPSPENRIRYLKEHISTKYPQPDNLKVGKEEFQTTVLDYLKTHPKPRKKRES
jgi:beta-barrel assembly-enhancing protease